MKIRHLLLVLMICVAGTGAIDLSGGFLDDQNTTQLTPFLIFGHVWYEGGAPCNSPNVSITNMDTGAAWYADTVSGCNYYQTILSAANVSAGDVLRWSATDGAVMNTTNRAVDQGDIESDGIFGFDVILQSITPRIIGYAPESPVYDIENAARRFNITIDQVVDVAWQINGSPIHTNESVIDVAYTHTNVAIGVWNVSARASNVNGTDMQEWLWYVNPPSPPLPDGGVVSASSDSNATEPVFIYGWVLYENSSGCIGPLVNISNLNTSMEWQAETHNVSHYYQLVLDSANVSAGDVLLIDASKNGTPVGNVTHTVNQTEIEQGAIEMNVNTWMPDLVIPESGVSIPPLFVNETNTINVTVWNNGTGPSGAFNVSFSVNGQANASCEYINETRISDGLQQSSSINISFSWQPTSEGSHNITFFTDSNHEINESNELNNNLTMTTSVGVPDFIVTNLTLTHKPLVIIGDIIRINATIANIGTEGKAFVRLYDNKSITIERLLNDYPETPINDTITLPDVKRIRVHFESFDVSSGGNITIYNETQSVEGLNGTGTDNWTEWCDGGTIRINSWNAGFTVDRYEAVLANGRISLGAGNSTNISAVWNLSDQSMGWAVHGSHNITVRADPYNELVEYDETNNEKIEVIDVHPSLDFAVTEMSLDPSEPALGDVVGITANISNYGVRNGTTVVGVFYDNRSIDIETKIPDRQYSTDNISLPADVHGLRIRFSYYKLGTCAYINIYDENGRLVERIYQIGEKDGDVTWIGHDYWTDCIYSNAVTIEMYSGYGSTNFKIDRYEALIAEEPVTLNATESKIINASWLTGAAYGAAREHDITVMVDPRDHSVETNETNNTRSEGIFVNGTDLTVTGIEMPCGSSDNPCYVGQDVEVFATIANIGAVDATNFTVIFKDGLNCSEENMNRSGVNFTETHIERLNSGENMNISVIWNPAEINNHTITASIPYEATDNNETNNELSDCSDVEAKYDFFVESVNVDLQTAEKADSVNITATIGNSNVSHTGGKVSIGFFVNSTDFAGTFGERFTRIGTIDDVHLEVNETKTVSMSWDVNVVSGCHLIAAVVNPDNELEELDCGTKYLHDTIQLRGDPGNNVKTCTLHVKPLDLDIADITLDPTEPNIGDLVDVVAEIRNNGGVEANSTVWFYMERNESIDRRSSWGIPKSWSSALQPEVPIRFHFDYIRISKKKAGTVNASVTDRQGQHHPVCFYVKCGEGHDAKTSKIDYDTRGYVAGGGRRWNDVWTDWTNGTAIEINAINEYNGSGYITEVELSIDRYQLRLGNRTVTLTAGESGLYNAEWNTSLPLKPGKNYTILANVENRRKESNVIRLGGTDLTITDLSVKPVVRDGEAVWVNATIENLGRMDATAFTVKFTEIYHPEEVGNRRKYHDHLETITETRIEGLDSGNFANISVLWNASIREIEFEGVCRHPTIDLWIPCEWIEIADDYNISVEIDPLENLDIKEDDSTNYSLERCVHVDYSRDFNVTNLSFSVSDAACDPLKLDLYDDVILNATVNITNLMDAGSVDVGFYIDEVSDEHTIGSCSITFDAGNGTGYAEIEWSAMCPPGDHDIIVVADPEGKIQEISETNNNLTQKIFVNAPELVLESLGVHPMNPEGGETVSINVTIANVGGKDTSNVTLCIYEWAERQIENLCEQSGPGRKQIEITRENATAMRLYLDLEVGAGCRVCINDGSGSRVICYDKNFHGWTPWMFDNSTTIVVANTETEIASARVSKLYYIAPSSIIDTSVHDLKINETKNITVDWNTSVVGERFIAAIVDPEGDVTEYNESNNRLAEFISVQTADLIVSNLSLWLNGTEIGEDDTIKHGDNVTITTDLANIGVDDADNFSVRFLIDDILIKEEPISVLANGSTIPTPLVANWSATVGSHVVKVEADWENGINETNETNNIVAWARYVSGAELSGDLSWITLGLDGEVLFGPTEPYDEDEVVINATINNSGEMPATNFSAAIFFDCTSSSFSKGCCPSRVRGEWENRTYPDAEYIYLNVTTPVYVSGSCRGIPCRCMIKDDVIIYDGNDSEVARPHKSCSVMVKGNTANVFITSQGYSRGPVFDIHFYPIYQNGTSMLFEGIDVPANSSYNISMNRTVSVGDFAIMVVIDPENKAPEDEDHKEDNSLSGMMSVKPTRDFTVTSVMAECINLSDLDTTNITAEVSNIGLRNGTTDVSFVDYEVERRRYKYHFNRSFNQSYLPIPPDATLSGLQYHGYVTQDYENLMMIHRPGVDAIELHLNTIDLDSPSLSDKRQGVISVRDENEEQVWIETYISKGKSYADVRVPGETAYIYTCRASFVLGGYTTEKELLREEVRLNSTTDMNESKNITSMWNAYTGDHAIAVILDGDNKITEINESNNKLSPLFHVNASRDPAIVELNIAPEHPKDGGYVNITAIIANNGSKDASFTFDLWANATRNKDGADESLPGANLTTDLGDKIRYIRLLKHVDRTLAPGKNTTVNATWNGISIAGDPTYHIIAIVDPTDEIDEMNESNNEIEKEIRMAYPDLTVGTAHVHGGTGKPVVNIKEIGGISGASDVTVRFESYETEECNIRRCGRIRHHGASNMQVYFDHIDARNGYVEVGGKRYSGGEFSDEWSPWVEGDSIRIKCRGGGTGIRITEYRWGNVSDEQIDYIPAGGSKRVEIPWTDEYREPYDLNVTVDPDNNITELREDNNNKPIRMYADIVWDWRGGYYCPKYLAVDHPINYIMSVKNVGLQPLPKFNVTLYAGLDGEEMVPVENHTIEEILKSGGSCPVKFEWEPPVDGSYNFTMSADPENMVIELDESNNKYHFSKPVFKDLGYGGSYLKTYADGEVNGSFIFKMGDRGDGGDQWYGTLRKDGTYMAKWNIPLPADAKIEIARLYLYWGFTSRGKDLTTPPTEFNVQFNDHLQVPQEPAHPDYSDYPIEEGVDYEYNFAYGVYCYDVKDYVTGSDDATVTIDDLHGADFTCIAGMSLVIVYESDEGVLTKYWINEGADVLGCGGSGTLTPLYPDDCTTEVVFGGEADSDGLSNATLITVVPWGNRGDEGVDPGFYRGTKWVGKKRNGLYFNGKEVKDGAYRCDSSRDSVGIDERDVKDHLAKRDNVAEIQDRGDSMMVSANGFLVLRYPPDLNIIDLTAPASTVVGAHHPIDVTIRNDGRSDAHDFAVTFYIDGKQMVRIPHLDLPAGNSYLFSWDDVPGDDSEKLLEWMITNLGIGWAEGATMRKSVDNKIIRVFKGENSAEITIDETEEKATLKTSDGRTYDIEVKKENGKLNIYGNSMTLHLYNWTPMLLSHVYNLTAAADVLSGEDWTEVETENNALTKYVMIEEGGFGNQTGPRGEGGGSNPTGGVYTEKITGRVMQGMNEFLSFGGGGGAGMFSLMEWIMKGAVWLALMLFVCVGYWMEQRSYGRVSRGLGSRI